MAAGKDTFHDDFRLSITKALGDQLAVALAQLGRAPLNEASSTRSTSAQASTSSTSMARSSTSEKPTGHCETVSETTY